MAPVSGGAGEILLSDFTGDGTTGDPLPGTHLGQFDRGTNAQGLINLVNKYNSTVAGQPTPAGQAVIAANLMTLPQLQALGGVAQPIIVPPSNQVDFSWLKVVDFKLAWRYSFKEKLRIEPSVGFYNVFNFANFNPPPNTRSGILDGQDSSINSVPKGTANDQFRAGNGTGVYSLGAPRQIEGGLRIIF